MLCPHPVHHGNNALSTPLSTQVYLGRPSHHPLIRRAFGRDASTRRTWVHPPGRMFANQRVSSSRSSAGKTTSGSLSMRRPQGVCNSATRSALIPLVESHAMSTPDPSVIRKAAAEFQTKRPVRFEILQPWKDVIKELRSKCASCSTIAEFLNGYGIQTSKSAIANFCKEVLKEPGKRKQKGWRRKRQSAQSKKSKSASHNSFSPIPEVPRPNEKHVPIPHDADPLVASPRKRGPRIAQVELLNPNET